MSDQSGSDSFENKSFEEKVNEMIKEIRPMLQSHGGGIELVSIEDDKTVKVKLKGACAGCPGAQATLKQGVEKLMKESIPELKEVVAVN